MNTDIDVLKSYMTQKLFHFSSKAVHSNASVGGVRLGSEQALDLPYIGARTLMSEGASIGLDYIDGATSASHLKRIRLIEENGADPDLSTDECSDLMAHLAAIGREHAEHGLYHVSMRLRQVLLPKDGQYISMTPMSSAGLCEFIINKFNDFTNKQIEDGKKENRRLPRPERVNSFSVGGSNPQNVGGRVRALHKPVVFVNVPRIDLGLRHAMSTHFKGFRPRIPREFMNEFAEHQSIMRNQTENLVLKKQELEIIKKIMGAVHNQAKKTTASLERYSSEITVKNHDELMNAVLKPNPANAGIRAHWLIKSLSGFRLGSDDANAFFLILSTPERDRIHNAMKEI